MGKINENIKILRKEKQLTLEEVAKKIGTTKETIQRYESGKISNIPYDKIISIAQVFNVTPSVLMGWEELPEEDRDIKAEAKEIAELIKIYKQITPEKKEQLLNIARTFK